jgi:hypothetical protein
LPVAAAGVILAGLVSPFDASIVAFVKENVPRGDLRRELEFVQQFGAITSCVLIAGVVALLGWHGFLAVERRRVEASISTRSGKFWRMTNEIPFVIAIVMVIIVIVSFVIVAFIPAIIIDIVVGVVAVIIIGFVNSSSL